MAIGIMVEKELSMLGVLDYKNVYGARINNKFLYPEE